MVSIPRQEHGASEQTPVMHYLVFSVYTSIIDAISDAIVYTLPVV